MMKVLLVLVLGVAASAAHATEYVPGNCALSVPHLGGFVIAAAKTYRTVTVDSNTYRITRDAKTSPLLESFLRTAEAYDVVVDLATANGVIVAAYQSHCPDVLIRDVKSRPSNPVEVVENLTITSAGTLMATIEGHAKSYAFLYAPKQSYRLLNLLMVSLFERHAVDAKSSKDSVLNISELSSSGASEPHNVDVALLESLQLVPPAPTVATPEKIFKAQASGEAGTFGNCNPGCAYQGASKQAHEKALALAMHACKMEFPNCSEIDSLELSADHTSSHGASIARHYHSTFESAVGGTK